MQVFTDTRETAHYFVKTVVAEAVKSGHKTALVTALYGDLGAGKTSFVQHVAELLGITERVISPTFILERVYDLPESAHPLEHLVHIDAYRLENGAELKQLGWDELIRHPANVIFVEWADKVEDALPDDAVKIYFEFEGERERKIQMKNF